MNKLIYLSTLLLLTLGTGCDKEDIAQENPAEQPGGQKPSTGQGADIPEGYFEVVFTAPDSRAVSGQDGRVRDVRYLLFKSTGEFVKERQLVSPTDPVSTWPLASVRDTLPKGSYRAVFLGNVQKTLFPYALPNSPVNYSEVLSGYQSGYASGRIALPAAEFSSTTEYYMANVSFSDTATTPYILMQRIIGMLNLHRNFVDAQTALNQLTANIFTNVQFKNNISLQLQSILHDAIYARLDKGSILGNAVYVAVGGLDALVAGLTTALNPLVTDLVYNVIVQQLVNQIGLALTGNADQSGLLALLGTLLNPWATNESDSAIVTINNFPASMDFDLTVQSVYSGQHKFKFKFTGGSVYAEKDILIKGFHGLFDVRKINVAKTGLVAGVLLDNIVDGPWLLNGTFIDVNDPIQFNAQTNRRYKSNYSLLDLGLKSYNPQTQTPTPLSVTVSLGSIPNLRGVLAGLPLLGPLTSALLDELIFNPLKVVNVTVPVNLPLLSIDNLKLSGGWDTPTAY